MVPGFVWVLRREPWSPRALHPGAVVIHAAVTDLTRPSRQELYVLHKLPEDSSIRWPACRLQGEQPRPEVSRGLSAGKRQLAGNVGWHRHSVIPSIHTRQRREGKNAEEVGLPTGRSIPEFIATRMVASAAVILKKVRTARKFLNEHHFSTTVLFSKTAPTRHGSTATTEYGQLWTLLELMTKV